MRRRLYIHIGPGKTGTTAIQAFFGGNQEALARRGLIYPAIGRFLKNDPAHHVLSHKWGGWIAPVRLVDRDPTAEWHALRDLIMSDESGARYVISSERFAGATLDPRYADMLRFIATLLEGIEVKIVAYVRPQEEMAESHYKQRVKTGLIAVPFEEFLDDLPDYFDYQRLLQAWAESFGAENLIVRRFVKRGSEGRDVIDDILAALETEWSPDLVRVGEVNSSINAMAARLIVDLELRKRPDFMRVKRILRDRLPGPGCELLSAAAREEIRVAYGQSNAAVGRMFFGNDDALFPPGASAPPRNDRIEIGYDDLRRLLKDLLEVRPPARPARRE